MINRTPRNPSATPSPMYTVNVVRDEEDSPGSPWCASVVGVEGAVAWGADFEDLERDIRAALADLHPDVEPELTWQIDSIADTSHQMPLDPR